MRIVSSYRGNDKTWESASPEVTFGRADEKSASVLDLFPDQKVSRMHGRIWEEGGNYWIEDLNSRGGTRLNGVEIKGKGKQQVRFGDSIAAGETTLKLEAPPRPHVSVKQTSYLEHGTVLLPGPKHAESGLTEAGDAGGTILDAFAAMTRAKMAAETVATPAPSKSELLAPVAIDGVAEQTLRRLRMLCDLPLELAGKTNFEALLRLVVDRLVELIPNGETWGLVLHDVKNDSLLLKAYHAAGACSVSETLVRRAVNTKKAFIWKRSLEGAMQGTLLAGPISAGIYAPLLWHDQALGVLCVDAHKLDAVFTEDDLRLLVVVAQYAAMAVASQQLQEQLKRESAIKANFLRQFSPAVAEQLMAHKGRLRLGGQRNEVTLLCSDIRGFTLMSADLEPDEVVETLNDYFGCLVPIIFANRGTIDKFIGDAILAVFGSPEKDLEHDEHAVKAALEMQAAMAKLNEKRTAQGLPAREIGIGIHCGEVVQGFVGTANRMEFTVIGDPVNKASRYCAAAAGKEILISPDVYERLWRMVEAEETTITTKHEGDLRAYRVRALKKSAEERPGKIAGAGEA